MKCDRCRKPTNATMMSKFNTAEICIPCKDREESHPDYAAADRAEVAAVRNGDMNFPGVGLPADL
jgi:hypothetical protein